MNRKELSVFNPIHLSDQSAYKTTKGPKCRERAQGKSKITKKQGEWTKSKKRAQLSVDRAPAPSRRRTRTLLSLIWKFPLVAHPRDPEGAPAPPHFVTTKTRTSRARAMEMARPRGDGRFT
ncbi:hypothetical protein PIB30_081263 [Stylosanthes scabra]|uniref:Uncharacterized protein n=1 Tax=Stylosanthes scabra TaxID=79078 RepID=A0ABU6WPW8_9FABA|nr:hypothetical protein [Stylosanthes scabra]